MGTRSNYMRQIQAVSMADDSKAELIARVKKLPKDELFHAKVLVATFIPSEKTAGGIILPDRSKQESRFQEKTGLVIGVGPGAFQDGPGAQFYGKQIKVGDWVLFRASDGYEFFIDEVPCRMFEDVQIMMKIQNPELYY
jgi:co-chaperonin GroES (HSP10)